MHDEVSDDENTTNATRRASTGGINEHLAPTTTSSTDSNNSNKNDEEDHRELEDLSSFASSPSARRHSASHASHATESASSHDTQSAANSPRRRGKFRESVSARKAARTTRRKSLDEIEIEALEAINQVRRYSDSYVDFRPAAALAGLYPNRVPAPLHLNHETVWKSLGLYLKNKTKYFWHGQNSKLDMPRYTLPFLLSLDLYLVSLFGVLSMKQSDFWTLGTGLLTTNYSNLHVSTQIITMLLSFGGSPLTVILPITLVIRKHCKGPKPRAALMRLFLISTVYYVVFIIGPFFIYSFYLLSEKEVLGGVNPFWFSIFHSISAFTNSGISLFSDSMMRFATNYLMNLLTAFQIVFGYLAIPLALRFCIWLTTFIPWVDKKPSIMLLKTPAFAGYLFPRVESQIIMIVIILIIIVGTVSNFVVEWDQSLKQFSPADKILVAFFNDVTTRNAGFNTIDFSTNYDVTNIIAIFWMYIAGYPVGVRVTRSLHPQVLGEYVGYYFRKFLVSGKWWIAIAILVITMAERHKLQSDPDFTFFKVLFELISAYGTVGLSLGYRGLPYSFCGVWRNISKIALIFIMFIGRHRRLKGTLLNSVQEANTIGNNLATQIQQQDDDEIV